MRISAPFFLVPLLILALGWSGPAQKVIKVPEQYGTIQAAIDAAKNSDVISVGSGTYRETINFKGKAISVQSRDGALNTVLDGGMAGSVVTFNSGEGPASILQGFTITNGSSVFGGGIHCMFTSPTIQDNVVILNVAQTGGGGLFARESHATITRCSFMRNYASSASGSGGGMFLFRGRPTITNSIFWRNVAGLHGGGMYLSNASPIITNSTMYDNAAPNEPVQSGRGNAIFAFNSPALVTNSIVRTNSSQSASPVLAGYGSSVFPEITYCNIDSYSGQGNFSSSPTFVDDASGDFHLRSNSPNISRGISTAPALPSVDFEGDPRPASHIDVGADQFHPHLYSSGTIRPGGTLNASITGQKYETAAWAFNLNRETANPPLTVPGLQGVLHLQFPIGLIPFGSIPKSGATGFSIPLPWSTPVGTRITSQALIGTTLSNLEVIVIL